MILGWDTKEQHSFSRRFFGQGIHWVHPTTSPCVLTRNARLPLEKLPLGSVAGPPTNSAVKAVWFRVRLTLSQEKFDKS